MDKWKKKSIWNTGRFADQLSWRSSFLSEYPTRIRLHIKLASHQVPALFHTTRLVYFLLFLPIFLHTTYYTSLFSIQFVYCTCTQNEYSALFPISRRPRFTLFGRLSLSFSTCLYEQVGWRQLFLLLLLFRLHRSFTFLTHIVCYKKNTIYHWSTTLKNSCDAQRTRSEGEGREKNTEVLFPSCQMRLSSTCIFSPPSNCLFRVRSATIPALMAL